MRSWVRDRGLLLVNGALFVVFFCAMAGFGFAVHNADQSEHGSPSDSFGSYLGSGDFAEATFENWESEFLQMGMYVVLTAYLVQRGSSESRPIGRPVPQDEDPREARDRPGVPWPVRRGGLVLRLYEHSLSTMFFVLFALSFALHVVGGARAYSEEQVAHGQPPVSGWQYLGTSQLWYESMQNWQSEFLAIAVMVGASVYLRERRSAESKPVAEPHHSTGA